MKKGLWLALALCLTVVVILALRLNKSPGSQTLTLPNGERYRFYATVWGTNNFEPPPTLAARVVSHLPGSAADFVRRKLGGWLDLPPKVSVVRISSGPGWQWELEPEPKPPEPPSLHIWLRQFGTNASVQTTRIRGFLTGEHGLASGLAEGGTWGGMRTKKWLVLSFPFPSRRSAWLTLHCFEQDSSNEFAAMTFRNPLFGRFPKWQSDPLPVSRTNGGLEVRLIDFALRASNVPPLALTAVKPVYDHYPIGFREEKYSPRGTNEIWYHYKGELSDATGNRAPIRSFNGLRGEEGTFIDQLLPPDEPAWRLKLEFKRYESKEAEDLVTFTNVPLPAVGARSVMFLTNQIHGVPVILKQVILRRTNPPSVRVASLDRSEDSGLYTEIALELPDKPAGMAVDFLGLTADTGWKAGGYSYREGDVSAGVLLSIPAGAATLNVTWSVQRTRTVEFLVKPKIKGGGVQTNWVAAAADPAGVH
jgi:hypothetical protein